MSGTESRYTQGNRHAKHRGGASLAAAKQETQRRARRHCKIRATSLYAKHSKRVRPVAHCAVRTLDHNDDEGELKE